MGQPAWAARRSPRSLENGGARALKFGGESRPRFPGTDAGRYAFRRAGDGGVCGQGGRREVPLEAGRIPD
eukprot:11219096-Lingulodinium_polyedra.AAC.1